MANMIPISSFFPLVKPYAPACPDPVAEQMIRLAAIEFCERTRCWRHIVQRRISGFDDGCRGGPIRILPPYATIFEFEFAYFNGSKLDALQFSEVDVAAPGQENEFIGFPAHITQTEPNTVMIIPAPDASGTLNMSIFLKPVGSDEWSGSSYDQEEDDDLNVLPDFLLIQQGEAITHGALSRILALPKQSYSNPEQAEFYRLSFKDKCDTRFQSNLRGQQRAQPRSKAIWF